MQSKSNAFAAMHPLVHPLIRTERIGHALPTSEVRRIDPTAFEVVLQTRTAALGKSQVENW